MLPHHIQPKRLAEQRKTLQGSLNLKLFQRLAGLISNLVGTVNVQLEFGQDEQGLSFVRGQADTILPMQCQRCMGAMDWPLKISISLSPVFSETASKELPECYEPLLLQEDKIGLVDLIEEELLLNLPLVPKHEKNCHVGTMED
jgi:DUF177 domain-containing protein